MELYEIRKALMSGKTIYDLPLRVTYYARVSTDTEEQKNSLENQDTYYKNKILSIPKWSLVKGYTDEGITGTSTKKREYFNEMVEDGLNDKYDLILTKEVCRFARNTLDTLQITRNLLAKGKGVYFELDNINTLEQEGELRLTIMASLAQDESRRISERVKFGFNRAIENGKVLGNNVIWGYTKDNCKLKINEEEAKIVRRVFEIYAEGKTGIRRIGDILAKEGFYSSTGKKFCYSTIRRIINNPKYKGWYCGKTTEVIDFLTKERIEIPKEDWIQYKTTEDIVPQIIDEDLWNKCNEIWDKRSIEFSQNKRGTNRWNSRYLYSGLLVCAEDNKTYWRTKHRPSANEEFWICSEYKKYGNKVSCTNTELATLELNQIMEKVFNELIENKEKIKNKMLEINNKLQERLFNENIGVHEIEDKINNLEEEQNGLIKLYSLNKIDEDQFEEYNNEYKNKILEYKGKLIQNNAENISQRIEKNKEKIKQFFDFDKFELTSEFLHKKINKMIVKEIEKNYVSLKINFHLDLEMSEVDKKSICLGLIIWIDGARAFNFTPNLVPCFIISGSSKINSSIEGVTIPYPVAFTSSRALEILSYSFLVFASSVIVENKSPSFSILIPEISVRTL